MSDFETAIDLVHRTLHDLHELGASMTVSTESLARLASLPKLASRTAPAAATAAAPATAGKTATVVREPAASPAEERRRPAPAAEAPVISSAPLPPRSVAPPKALESRVAPLKGTKAERIAAMRGPVLACTKCPNLVASRTGVVFGVGNPEAELMFVGEAPGEDEDLQGEPFVGKAGQLLTKIIETMGYQRGDIYIANVLKCRPDMAPGMPGNRKPKSEEMQTCLPYLREQIDIIQPRLIVGLGATAMEGLLGTTEPMAKLRGRFHDFQGTPLMATYHPAYLLRNQSLGEKRKVWEDMLKVLEKLGRPITEKQRSYFLQK